MREGLVIKNTQTYSNGMHTRTKAREGEKEEEQGRKERRRKKHKRKGLRRKKGTDVTPESLC